MGAPSTSRLGTTPARPDDRGKLTTRQLPALNDPEIVTRINELRQTDNYTNWYYLLREYTFLAFVIGGSIAAYVFLWDGRWSLLWAAPMTLAAILCVGAGQHRLATLGHEAAHYMLFKNRVLNELASEWWCMFPIFASTHRYRMQHLGHHQHTNDVELDPDLAQLQRSGHGFAFPLTLRQFIWQCVLLQIFWLPNLLRYVLVRATFHFERGTPALATERRASRILTWAGPIYYLVLGTALACGIYCDESWLLFGVPMILLLATLALVLLAPGNWFPEYQVRSEIPERFRTALRWTYYSLLLCGIAWLTAWTTWPWWFFYVLLWLIPASTSFAFFMMLGQVAQHGNAGAGRFNNTRVFLVHPLIRMSVFPIGNDYHITHHLFMNVPHYNLRKLHDLLMHAAPYQDKVAS